MKKSYFKSLDLLLNTSTKVLKCSMKRCKKYMKNDNTDKIKKLLKEKDSKKKETTVNKLASDKEALKEEKCIYSKCKKIHMKLIKILIKTTKIFMKEYPKIELLNSNIKTVLKELKRLSEKTNLSSTDINEMHKYKNIVFFNILNIKL